MTATVSDLGETVRRTADRVGPAVAGLGRGSGRGSGVVIGENLVLTNAHNLRRDELVLGLTGGERVRAEVVGVDADADIAVLRADTGAVEPVEWGDPAGVGIGTPVLALANPGGRGLRVTLGFACSAGRSFRGPRGRRVEGAIEHTAPLPRGSSGGPLVDAGGGLIGLNSLRLEGGLILALPTTPELRERVARLARGEPLHSRRLGVAVAPPRVSRRMRQAVGLPEREGLLVRAVEENSPAQRAGVERGDLLVAIGDQQLRRVDALYAALDAVDDSGALRLTIVRGTEQRDVDVIFAQGK